MIPRLDAAKIEARDPDTLAALREGAEGVGFLTVHNTGLSPARMRFVLAAYRAFFDRPEAEKAQVDMARTGANRGWGAGGSEQVDPEANPDYKQVFDCGYEWPEGDQSVYAPNLWPARPAGFREVVEAYYADAMEVSRLILRGIAEAIGQDRAYFDDKFDRPMALLRGNYYPARPDWAGARDFGIATHTDYGCLTLLASDGVPGLEVRRRGGGWIPVTAGPGDFVINFGEMLEMWTAGRVRATPHRVKGTAEERISIPLFFNPRYDTNVAPLGSGEVILAGEHLSKRYAETYVHLQNG
ncbi:isopenicillin N synthase family dioxygenase [Aestuariicoccus sp. MJ-SS9]|uniref:isopenicillin N synthase family dioxygenase n=1 Tax=Aestuariicoccus sp. MJ-SS9 TaxID=3079855 RepID=UPI00291507FC|nr:2-oxoglutarate and iron-dependent oxygenase domain-containing protein [Aestuariicoccus sp. MJ-SS9]MDU8910608.1 2-oxoglutarate and iron-dependent oxygenase domain-containing protein [Aestuariicoccus sp. MJ-SS9]